MQVKMLMRGDVVQRQTGGAERLELGAHLRQHLPANTGQKKHCRGVARHTCAEATTRINQIRDSRGRQNRLRVDQRQVQPDR